MEKSLFTAQELLGYLVNGEVRAVPRRVVILDQPLRAHQFSSAEVFSQAGIDCAVVKDVAVVSGLGIGGPALAMAMEILKVMGAREFVHLGTAGTLTNELKVGETILVTKALDDEGTAAHYVNGKQEFSLQHNSWEEWFRTYDYQVRPTTVWTTAAPFRETPSACARFVKAGARAVEMEAATGLAVAEALDLKFTSIKVISDQVLPTGWQPHFKDEKVKSARRKILDLLTGKSWP